MFGLNFFGISGRLVIKRTIAVEDGVDSWFGEVGRSSSGSGLLFGCWKERAFIGCGLKVRNEWSF